VSSSSSSSSSRCSSNVFTAWVARRLNNCKWPVHYSLCASSLSSNLHAN
jgi:hypothetical protein